MKDSKVNLFDYMDFRSFVKDRMDELRSRDGKFSFRYFSNKLGLRSKSHLNMVLDGQRRLRQDLARPLALALGLSREETAHFCLLVEYTQAKGAEEKAALLRKLRRKGGFREVHDLSLHQFDYLADPLQVTLREWVFCSNFRNDPKRLARDVRFGKPTTKSISKARDALLRVGLLVQDESGALIQAEKHHQTGDDVSHLGLKMFYKNAFRQADKALELDGSQRHLGGMTMAVSQKGFARIRERYQEFVDDVRDIVDDDDEADTVMQMLFALYPLTKAEQTEDE